MSSNSSNAAIELINVGKEYRLYSSPQDRLKQMLLRGRKKFYREFWALRDINLSIKAGSTVGILGRNGAGKSTLLQIMCGTTAPTQGQVSVQGRIGALLELGTGFNPEFTGRENIYLNASILGLSHDEIEAKLESILDFADISHFIEQPVKTYSSGMFVRLAFAIAININPQILIVDEAISVGDVKFQVKCFRKFEELKSEGRTIIFVSHSPEQVIRHCERAFLLENGRLIEDGEPKAVANRYLDLMFGVSGQEEKAAINQAPASDSVDSSSSTDKSLAASDFWDPISREDNFCSRPGYNNSEYRWGNRAAEIVDFSLSSGSRKFTNHFASTEKISLAIKVIFKSAVSKPVFGLTIKTPDGVTVSGFNSLESTSTPTPLTAGAGETVFVTFTFIPKLVSGHYLLSLGVVDHSGDELVPLDRRYDAIEIFITNPAKIYGIADLAGEILIRDKASV